MHSYSEGDLEIKGNSDYKDERAFSWFPTTDRPK